MDFRTVIESIPQDLVERWWRDEAPATAPAQNEGVYYLKKDGKELPFKFVVVEIARKAGHDLSVGDFSSESSKRALFADRFGFRIEEKLGYNNTELADLQRLHSGLRDPGSFKAFLSHANHLVTAIGIAPYVIRMALPEKACLLELGARAILKYREIPSGIEVKFMLLDEDVKQLDLAMSPEVERFRPVGASWVTLHFASWSDIPAALLEQNERAVRLEYDRVKDSRLSEIRLGSKTTNAALKYAVYQNEDITSMRPIGRFVQTQTAMDIFKLGCNWGKGQPDYYDMIREHSIIITVPDYLCSVGDLIVVTSGYRVRAIAQVTSAPVPVTRMRELMAPFAAHNIDYRDSVLVANADWYALPADKEFEYRLQQGIVRVQDQNVRRKVVELWNERSISTGMTDIPLNTILYGPPGTGKTYHTVVRALAIIEGKHPADYESADRSDLRKRFERLVKQRRIVMSTFHQSMSYEDFVEGIKPQADKDNGQVSYSIEPGIFKRVCAEAAYEYVKASLAPVQRDIPFDELFSAYTDLVEEQLDAGKEVRIPTRSGKELQVVDISERGNIKLRHVNHTTSREYVVSLERSRALNAAFEDLNAIDNIDREFREVIGGSNGTAYWAVLNQVRATGNVKVPADSASEQDLMFEDKLPHAERLDWTDRRHAGVKTPPFVLIIDEINRGNIAGIFGELITLIEPDKRAFNAEVAQVVLPYSKKPFAVPPNLYIIGTMNTADRSVEALDTALRRRFSFVEMPSRPELVKQPDGFAVKLQPLLAAINGRVERLLDKDHHIGHSYFMDIHAAADPEWELRLVFKNKVLPLLQEYFYGDPRKLGAVLGPHWVKKREASTHKLYGKFDIDDAGKDVFDVADSMDAGLDAFAELYD